MKVALGGGAGQGRQSAWTIALPCCEVEPVGQGWRTVVVPYWPAGLIGRAERPRLEQAPVVAL